jgi:hypothetical protein
MRKTTYSMMRHLFHDARPEISERVEMTFGHVKVILPRSLRSTGIRRSSGQKLSTRFSAQFIGENRTLCYKRFRIGVVDGSAARAMEKR